MPDKTTEITKRIVKEADVYLGVGDRPNAIAVVAEEIRPLVEALEWIITDLQYAAPETYVMRSDRWCERAQQALTEAAGETAEKKVQ